MPSSESVRRRIVVAKGLVVGLIILLAACSAAPVDGRVALHSLAATGATSPDAPVPPGTLPVAAPVAPNRP